MGFGFSCPFAFTAESKSINEEQIAKGRKRERKQTKEERVGL
jgi:hypothetical protein